MMLDRVDELSLRHHVYWGNPAALLAKLITQIDRLKDEMVTRPRLRELGALAGRSGHRSAGR